MPGDLGTAILGISPKEFKEAQAELLEDLALIRQDAFDMVMDMLGDVVTPLNVEMFKAELTARGFAKIAAVDPRLAIDILQDVRKKAG